MLHQSAYGLHFICFIVLKEPFQLRNVILWAFKKTFKSKWGVHVLVNANGSVWEVHHEKGHVRLQLTNHYLLHLFHICGETGTAFFPLTNIYCSTFSWLNRKENGATVFPHNPHARNRNNMGGKSSHGTPCQLNDIKLLWLRGKWFLSFAGFV